MRELRALDPLSKQYPQIDIYIISLDKRSDLPEIQKKNNDKGRTLTFVSPLGDSLKSLGILSRSNKIAFHESGDIVYRASMGKGSPGDWDSLFQELVSES